MKPVIRCQALPQTSSPMERSSGADSTSQPISAYKVLSIENDGRFGMRSCTTEFGPVHASAEPCTVFCAVCGRFCLWREVTFTWLGWVCASCIEELLTSEEMIESGDSRG